MPDPAFDAPLSLPPFFRASPLSADGGNLGADDRVVPLAFSSETPCQRTFPKEYPDKRIAGKTFHEVLDHSPGACDLSRLGARAPLLCDHDTTRQCGAILSSEIDNAARVGRARVKFSRSAAGQSELQDVLDGIRTNVSVGYRITRARIEPPGADGIPIIRATGWQPYEISTVSLPFDSSDAIGFGRSGAVDRQALAVCQLERNSPGGKTTSTAMPDPVIENPSIEVVRENARKEELTRSNEIRLQAQHWRKLGHDLTEISDKAIADGMTVADFQRAALEHAQKTKPIDFQKPFLNDKEKRRYSLCRAVSLLANNKQLDGLELECSREVERLSGKAPEGFYMPDEITFDRHSAQRGADQMGRALNVSNALQGGNTVQTDVLGGSLIELLRNKQYVRRLGAQSLDGLTGNVAIPRQTGAATGYAVAEAGSLSGSTQAIGQLNLTPHRIGAYNDFTKQLLAQSSIDVENFVRMDLMIVLAILSDFYALAGTGSNSQPTGIVNTSGIGAVTFGGAADWAHILSFETKVANANADLGALAYLTSPNARGKLKAATKIASSQYSDFIWEKGGAPGEGIINSYLALATVQLATVGSVNDVMIFGNWADLILAGWAGLDVVIDPYTQATAGTVRITVNQFMDVGIRHAASFVASADSAAQ